jgi:TatD DNase family protein
MATSPVRRRSRPRLSPMVDTHCHLDHCASPVPHVVSRARQAGVERVMAIGMTGDSCRHALAAADRHDEVFACIGRHPHESEGFDDAGLAELDELSRHGKARAIGETGLDYKRDYSPREDQRRAFLAQIELAQGLGRPLVIHTREAADDTLELLGRHADVQPVIIHCFSLGDRVEECVERGYYCSFAGNVTYPKATDLQRAAAAVPDELLLVETDAPYLSPQAKRGRPNEPAFVTETAAFVAELRGTTYEALEQTVAANAARLFGW